MSLLGVPGASEEVESATEAIEQLLRGEDLRPRRGELDRERQAIEAAAEPGDRLRVALRQTVVPRAGEEQRESVVLAQRRKVELCFALDSKRLAGRHDEPQRRRLGDERGERAGGRRQKVLEIVEDEMRPTGADRRGDRRRERGRGPELRG